MSTAQEIEAAFRTLSKHEQDELLERFGEIWEEGLELSDEFKAKIAAGQRDITEGRMRVRRNP